MNRCIVGDCLTVLPTLDVDSIDACVTDLAAGIAAEHLVCADLLLQGYTAFMADQNCSFDVAVQIDKRLVRIQVKATRRAKPTPQRVTKAVAYQFHTRRAGKGGRRVYGADEFDVLACVALDVRCIAYIPVGKVVRQTLHLRPPGSAMGHSSWELYR